MSQSRKIGVMIDNKDIEHNLGQMSDTIRNANYKMLEAKQIKPNEDGEYLDEDGDNLLMTEEVVKALLQDALDSYLMASVPGSKNHNPTDFHYYLTDSFPNIAEYLQANPTATNYVSALFATTCGMLAAKLTPAIQDIVMSNQTVGSIEVFNTGPQNSYYILQGEEDTVDNDPVHNILRLTPEQRKAQIETDLLTELGPEGYAHHQRQQRAAACAEGDAKFQDYMGALNDAFKEEAANGYPTFNQSRYRNLQGWVDAQGTQHVTSPHATYTRYYSSSVDDGTGVSNPTLDLVIHPQTKQEPVAHNEPLLFLDT